MKASGKAAIKNSNAIMDWISKITYAEAQAFRKHVMTTSREAEYGRNSSRVTNAEKNADKLLSMYGSWYSGQEEEKWARNVCIFRFTGPRISLETVWRFRMNGLWLSAQRSA